MKTNHQKVMFEIKEEYEDPFPKNVRTITLMNCAHFNNV